MNSIIFNIRKKIALSLFTAALSSFSLLSLANPGKEDPKDKTSTAEVKYIGTKGEMIFNVTYDNASGARFVLTLTDKEGNQLFQNAYSDKKFDKKFKIADPGSYGSLIFSIRNLADNSVQRFEVNATSHLVEDVNVKEVL